MADNIPIFLDTNILLRYSIVEAPEHARIRLAVERLLKEGYELWISRQVIREFCVVLTRPQTFITTLSAAEAASHIRKLLLFFRVADETASVTEHLISLMERVYLGGKQVHDANIAATMRAYQIQQLFTLNPADFVRFTDFITIVTIEELLKNGSQ